MAAPPSRDDRRIIIHFDYDCFYASVFEAEQPVLKSLPLAVQQKQIVVTCNYEARRRGLRKLQLIREAKQVCPDVVIVLGEDLSRFRDASKDLYLFLRAFVWGGKVEKLGFDELFMDVTEMIDYNVNLLNRNDLANSFFHLDRQDPTVGFIYDATHFHGPTFPSNSDPVEPLPKAQPDSDRLCIRLLVASHLAGYLRGLLEHDKGYTASVGISTSKLLSKLAGNIHKPNSLTTLLPPYAQGVADAESNVTKFLDDHEIRKIPGIGSKLAQKLTSHILTSGSSDEKVTVHDVRLFPGMGPLLLEKILGGPGSPKGIGARVWGLIHGVDPSEVSEARDLPTQISIEDTYGCLETLEGVKKALTTLAASLLRRVRTDLTEINHEPDQAAAKTRWLAYPKTLRLSTRLRPPPNMDGSRSRSFYNRISRSAPLPQYVFHLEDSVDAQAEKLVQELALSMFRKLHPEKSGWNLQLLNIAVTNMVEVAGEQKNSSGRDISKMFRNQETVLKEWRVPGLDEHDIDSPGTPADNSGTSMEHSIGTIEISNPKFSVNDAPDDAWEESEEEDSMPSVVCGSCGASIPHFALAAHEMYHSAPDTD